MKRPTDELSAMEYKSIMDACGRAHKAAKNAQRLSSAAATAFAEEAAFLEDVERMMGAKQEWNRWHEAMTLKPTVAPKKAPKKM